MNLHEDDIEEHMVMDLVPVRSYRVNLRVRYLRYLRKEAEAMETKEGQDKQENLQVVTLRLPPGLIKELDCIVETGGWASRSALVRQLLLISIQVKPVPFDETHFAALRVMMREVTGAAKLLRGLVEGIEGCPETDKGNLDP